MPDTPLAETPLLTPILVPAGPGVCCDDGWIAAQVMLFRVENEASGTHPTALSLTGIQIFISKRI